MAITRVKYALISFFVLYCIIFPANTFSLKIPLLICILLVCYKNLFVALHKSKYFLVLWFGIVYFLETIAASLVINAQNYVDIFSFSWVWLMLLLVPIIIENNIDYNRFFFAGSAVISLIIDGIFFLDIFNICGIDDNILGVFLHNTDNMMLGKASFSMFEYIIFYKTSPILIFSLCYSLLHRYYKSSILFFLALCLSGTRANFVISVALVIICFCYNIRLKRNYDLICKIFMFMVLLMCVYFFVADDFIYKSQIKSSISEDIKFQDVKDIFEIMSESWLNWMCGTGVGSYFMSTARGWVNVVEVAYLDYFRQVGALFYIQFVFFIIFPLLCLIKLRVLWLWLAYIGYLMVAATNPLLVSSTAFIVYILVYVNIINIKDQYKNRIITQRSNGFKTSCM